MAFKYFRRIFRGIKIIDMTKIKYGVYRVYWKCGGSSVAAIGGMHNGDLWIAPSNWTNEKDITALLKDNIDDILKLELIATQEESG